MHKLTLLCCLLGLTGASFSGNKEQPWECVVADDGVSWQCGRQSQTQPALQPPPQQPVTQSQQPAVAEPITPAAQPPVPAARDALPATSTPAPLQPSSEQSSQQQASDIPAQQQLSPAAPVSASATIDDTASEATDEIGTDLPSLDEGLTGLSCQPAAIPTPSIAAQGDEALHIAADSAVALPAEETAQFEGHVVLISPEHEIHADDLTYSRSSGEVSTQGTIQIRTDDLRLQGTQAVYQLTNRQGSLRDVEYRIPSQRVRGTAETAETDGQQQSAQYTNLTYTTCPVGNDDFVVSARSLVVDQANDTATFEGASLGFLGVPILYAPKMSVPLSDARKSGLLIPQLGYSSKNGLDLALPYYLNLAPNYDATLTPRIISKRGPALGGEFRFLADKHRGNILGEILYDRKYKDGEARGALHLDTTSFLAPKLVGDVQINYVSDDNYLEDLGDSLAVASTRHLMSRARLAYHADFWDLSGDVTHYNTLDDFIQANDEPYSQLPRIRFDLLKHDGPGKLDYSMLAEYIYFQRDAGTTGHRIDIHPGISLPWRNDWAFVEPEFTARYTGYQLQDQLPGNSSSPSRALYTASLDSGLYFDRSSSLFGRSTTQTLEPRAYYLYVPYEDQSDIPLFDTGLLDFNFDNLFRANRFNGPDRVGDANQLTLALSSSILDDASGEELLRASIGQIYYFEDRRVALEANNQMDTSSSSVIAQINGRINRQWEYRAGIQVDPHADEDSVRQGLAQVVYHGEQNQLVNAAYRLRDGVVEQTDLGVIWPVTPNLNMIGRWYYSLQDQQTMEAVAGLEYGRCCWRIRAVLRHYLDNNGLEYNNTAMIQLELNGLGKLGHDIDNYLDKSIYGY